MPNPASQKCPRSDGEDKPEAAAGQAEESVRLIGWAKHLRSLSRPRQLAVLILALVGLQVAFLALNVLAAAIPDGRIMTNISKSTEAVSLAVGKSDRFGGLSNTYTDCVEASTGLGLTSSSPLRKAIEAPIARTCKNMIERIDSTQSGGSYGVESTTSYLRYWTGYTILTRPLLWLFDAGALRMVASALLVVSAFLFFGATSRAFRSKWVPTVLAFPLLVSSNLAALPTASFSHTISYAVMFACLAMVAWSARRFGLLGVVLSSLISGALFNYVDLLTTPAIPWIWTAIIGAGVHYSTNRTGRAAFLGAVVSGLGWFLGFSLTWAVRWLIAILVLGPRQAIPNIFDEVLLRIDGEHSRYRPGFGNGIKANLGYWLGNNSIAWTVLAASLVLFAFLCVALVRNFGWRPLGHVAVLASIVLVVPIWLELLSNHSQVHRHFVYRDFPAADGLVMAAAVIVLLAWLDKPGHQGVSRGWLRPWRRQAPGGRTISVSQETQGSH